MVARAECHCCGSDSLRPFYEAADIPVHSCVLTRTRDEALAIPRRDLRLCVCTACGFVQNDLFDPSAHDYAAGYEETQAFSPRFREFSERLAKRLVDRYELREKRILEIGCGKADFLTRLCELGDNRGIGIDPACMPERATGEAARRIRFVRDFYSDEHTSLAANLVCCRHTLEHIQPVREFLGRIARSLAAAPESVVFVEVPDLARILRERAFWDIYYEHCSYFSAGSLARALRACELELLALSTGFGDQYLLAEARLAREPAAAPSRAEADLDALLASVEQFEQRVASEIREWSERLREHRARGRRVAVWGSGSKAVGFLTSLGVEDEIGCVVDVNPFRQRTFLPGTGHPIVAPEFLKSYEPDVILVMNPIYTDEIEGELRGMGLRPQLVRVGPGDAQPPG